MEIMFLKKINIHKESDVMSGIALFLGFPGLAPKSQSDYTVHIMAAGSAWRNVISLPKARN
jgi:hypothetical protein